MSARTSNVAPPTTPEPQRRQRLFPLVILLVAIPLLTSGLALYLLYRAALAEQLARLQEDAQRQANLLVVDSRHTPDEKQLLSNLEEAYSRFQEVGGTREMVVGKRQGEEIVFVFARRGNEFLHPRPIPAGESLGDPMRRALQGETGTMFGLDYRGQSVAAGYAPVQGLGWGVVSKMDLAEVRSPYLRIMVIVALVTLPLALLGAFLFYATARPLLARIHESEAYNRGLIESSIDGMATIDATLKITDSNQTMCRMTGRPRADLVGSYFPDLFAEREAAERGVRLTFEQGKVTDYVLTLLAEDRGAIPVSFNANVYRDAAGKVCGIFAAARDITERQLAEQALKAERKRFADVLDMLPIYVILLTPEYHVPFANRFFRQRYGEAQGRRCYEYLFQRQEPCENCQSFKVLKTGMPLQWDWTAPDGREYHIFDYPFTDADGSTVILEAGLDLTERNRAQAALRISEERFALAVRGSNDGIWDWDLKNNVVVYSPRFKQLLGYAEHEIENLFSEFESRLHPLDRDRTRAAIQKHLDRQVVYDVEYRLRVKSGEYRWFRARGQALWDETGCPTRMAGSLTDITAEKQAEEEIRTLNRELEQRVQERTAELTAANQELEAFTYSVSHDLRAPLRQIDGFSQLLLEEHRGDLSEAARHCLARVRDGTRQMGQLVDDLLNLARVGRSELSRQVTGLTSLAEEALRDLRAEAGDRKIEFKIGSLPYAECDPALIKQVLTNLLSNAIKFTRPRERAVIEVNQAMVAGQPAVLVRDNGVGFSMKYADKLFGVFQRLHRAEDFEGTGVGLATVQRIIHKHGGRVWAEGELDKGATFYFTLGGAASAQPAMVEVSHAARAG